MNITLSKTSDVWRILIVDAAILAIICLVPTLSHLFSVPIYKLNPMTLCLLAGMLLVNDRRNAFLLALVLPLVSMLISGMPTPLKCVYGGRACDYCCCFPTGGKSNGLVCVDFVRNDLRQSCVLCAEGADSVAGCVDRNKHLAASGSSSGICIAVWSDKRICQNEKMRFGRGC